MLFDPQIRPPSRQCAISGEDFAPGERVVSYLFPGKGDYVRVDVRAAAADDFTLPGFPICRWTWEVRTPDNAGREAAKASMAQRGELFLALCHADDEGAPPAVVEERAALRHLLGLMLQRKRLLKPLKGEGHRFLHTPTGQEVQVPPVPMTVELLRRVVPQVAGDK